MAHHTITLTQHETEQFEDDGPVGDAYRQQLRRRYKFVGAEIMSHDGYTLDALTPDIEATIEACDWYCYGDDYIAVLTGMPAENVWLGVGDSQSAAIAALARTPVQGSGPRGGAEGALRWAISAGWLNCEIDDIDAIAEWQFG